MYVQDVFSAASEVPHNTPTHRMCGRIKNAGEDFIHNTHFLLSGHTDRHRPTHHTQQSF
jgi:hypothetical protein